jgi:hypothetical protein
LFCLPSRLEELYIAQLLAAFDAQLVGLISAVPGRCTLGQAIQWNTVITICDIDSHIALPLFRQAATVFQGAMVLCAEPSVKDDTAPSLSAPVVLRILNA